MLSGRNFVTKDYEDEIRIKTFKDLESGILDVINQSNFERFIMILKSAGIIIFILVLNNSLYLITD